MPSLKPLPKEHGQQLRLGAITLPPPARRERSGAKKLGAPWVTPNKPGGARMNVIAVLARMLKATIFRRAGGATYESLLQNLAVISEGQFAKPSSIVARA